MSFLVWMRITLFIRYATERDHTIRIRTLTPSKRLNTSKPTVIRWFCEKDSTIRQNCARACRQWSPSAEREPDPKPTRSPPLSDRMSRASSGVAISILSPSMIWRASNEPSVLGLWSIGQIRLADIAIHRGLAGLSRSPNTGVKLLDGRDFFFRWHEAFQE